MQRKLVFVLWLMILLSYGLYGQEKLTISLEEAKSYALAYNRQVKNAALAVELAQKRINESISSFLPQVDVAMDYSNYLGAEMEFRFSEEMPPTTIPFKATSNLYATVSQMVFSGNFIVGLQMLRIYKEMSGTNYQKTEQNIRELTIRAYQNALVADLGIQIIRENLDNTLKILENTKAMVLVGVAEKLDLDQFAVQLSALENAQKSSERQKELAYNLLRFQLGVPADTPLELTDPLDLFLNNIDFSKMLDEPFNIQDNLDYQVMLSQEQLSERQVGMQKMNFLPTLSSYYTYTSKILKSDFDIAPKNVIGLNLAIPILSSGMRSSQVNQARIQYETTQNNKSLLEEQLMLTEKQLRVNLASAYDQYLNRKNNVDVTLRIYESYQFKFEQGVASSLDLATANNNYLQAESEYLTSIITLLNAQLDLQKLMNKL
ncbi:MAG: TolC family protein [Bacteroidales bacterium]|nr:TolC family protein [Lentimicrobiaceae bacterium]MDD5694387.1 TolC family protein [Bacteroidales bacterium]